MPAYCRINKIDFKVDSSIQETAAPIQPAALVTKKADFIIMFRASNDEVAEQAASKVGVKLSPGLHERYRTRYLRQQFDREG